MMMTSIPWFTDRTRIAHAAHIQSPHMILTRCGLILVGASVQKADPTADQCSDCIGRIEHHERVLVKPQITRFGSVQRHTVNLHGVHHFIVSAYDTYPDINEWLGLINGELVYENYSASASESGRTVCIMELYWKEA